MIREIKAYELVCDGCDARLDEVFRDSDLPLEEADEQGWEVWTDEQKHYCAVCQEPYERDHEVDV